MENGSGNASPLRQFLRHSNTTPHVLQELPYETPFIPNFSHVTLALSICRTVWCNIFGKNVLPFLCTPSSNFTIHIYIYIYIFGCLINSDAKLYCFIQICLTTTRRLTIWMRRALLTQSHLLTLNVSNNRHSYRWHAIQFLNKQQQQHQQQQKTTSNGNMLETREDIGPHTCQFLWENCMSGGKWDNMMFLNSAW